MTAFNVELTIDGARDLQEIYEYIALHDSSTKADYVLDKIVETFEGLSTVPEHGPFPMELLALGIRQYRETFFKPYRIIYRIVDSTVYIMLIADGRRDMATLLRQRLLEG